MKNGHVYNKMFVVKHHNDSQWWQAMDIELGEIYCTINDVTDFFSSNFSY